MDDLSTRVYRADDTTSVWRRDQAFEDGDLHAGRHHESLFSERGGDHMETAAYATYRRVGRAHTQRGSYAGHGAERAEHLSAPEKKGNKYRPYKPFVEWIRPMISGSYKAPAKRLAREQIKKDWKIYSAKLLPVKNQKMKNPKIGQ